MLHGIGKGGHPVVEGMESNHWVALDIGKNGHAVFIAKTSNLRVADFFNSCYGASWQLVQISAAYIILLYKYLFHSSATIAPLCIYQFEVSVTPWKRLKHLKIGSFKSPPPLLDKNRFQMPLLPLNDSLCYQWML